MIEPCDLSATRARHLIRTGELSPEDLLESCIARVDAANPAINAIVATDCERARHEAAVAAQAVRDGAELGPLHGLPVGIKDLNATEGLRTTWGSTLYADHVPEMDEPMVARLRRAGAIIAAKTNTPEFGAGTHTTTGVLPSFT